MSNSSSPLIINGWKVFAHPLFLDQIEKAVEKVKKSQKKHPKDYQNKNPAKHLKAIRKVAFEAIPLDPARSEYRQGATLGTVNKHWFRAKFQGQYRLFFQYDTESRTIILAWVNDDKCLRAYESKTDAYAVFRKMLGKGHPPGSWDELLSEARAETARLRQLS